MADDVPTERRRTGSVPSGKAGTAGDQQTRRDATVPDPVPAAASEARAGTAEQAGRSSAVRRHWPVALVAAACVSLMVGGTHSAAQQSPTGVPHAEPLPVGDTRPQDADDRTADGGGDSDSDSDSDPNAAVSHTNDQPEESEQQGADDSDSATGSGTEPDESWTIPRDGVEPYEAGDTTLTYHHWTGVCADHHTVAEESDAEVTVTVVAEGTGEATVCQGSAVLTESTVELTEPIGDRTLVDERGEVITER